MFKPYQIKNFIHFIKSIPSGIKRLIKWAPIIWENYDWDYVYLLKIMYFKIDLMEKRMRTAQIIEDWETIADQMLECKTLLKNQIEKDEYDYVEEELEKHKEKWGDIRTTFNPDNSISIKSSKVQTPEEEEQERKEYLNIVQKGINIKKSELNKLFELLPKYIQGWWD